MTDAAQAITTETPGAPPAAPPAAPTEPEAKTPDQLAAEKTAADEAQRQQEEEDRAEETRVKKKPWFQKRFDELTKQREEARREAADHRRMLEQVINQNRPQPTPPQPTAPEFQPTTPPPTREQFEFDEDKYIDARYQWLTEQREAKAAHEKRVNEQRGTQQEFIASYEAQRTATVTAGREKYPDFESVVFALPPNVLSPEMALAIFQTGQPADVAYHLGKNPDEAARIAKLPPLKKAIELGKLEGKLAAAPTKTTQAPPVIKPIGGAEPAKTDSAKLARTDPEKWIEMRNAGKL